MPCLLFISVCVSESHEAFDWSDYIAAVSCNIIARWCRHCVPCCRLSPLTVCAPSVAHQFLQQAQRLSLLDCTSLQITVASAHMQVSLLSWSLWLCCMMQCSACALYGMVCQYQCILHATHRCLPTGDQGLIAFRMLSRKPCNVCLVYIVVPTSQGLYPAVHVWKIVHAVPLPCQTQQLITNFCMTSAFRPQSALKLLAKFAGAALGDVLPL